MKILGMALYPRRKTDAEYVQWVRKTVSRARGLAVFHGTMAIVLLACYFAIIRIVGDVDMPFFGLDEATSVGVRMGLVLGTFMGVMLVVAAGNIVWLIMLLKGQRTERLMLKFHDELTKKEGDAEPQRAQACSEDAPEASCEESPS